jgi:uncharacterized protein YkwD
MSNEPPFDDPDTEPLRSVGSGERKRAAVALTVLAVAAAILVGVMLYAFRSSSDGKSGPSVNAGPTGPAVQVTGGTSQTSPRSSATKTKPKATKTKASSSPPSRGPVSCPTSAPCAVPDDVGNAVQALNAFRKAHGVKPVVGTVSNAAKTCAVDSGNESSCPSGYFWEPVGRDGGEVITKIEAQPKGTSWLLDKTMTGVDVGWAYIPTSKSFECVLVAKR